MATFYSVIQPVLLAGIWTNVGSTPKIKREHVEGWSGIENEGILIEDSVPKELEEGTAIDGTIVYEILRGVIKVRSTIESELDKYEADIEAILKVSSLKYIILNILPIPYENKYSLEMEVEIIYST